MHHIFKIPILLFAWCCLQQIYGSLVATNEDISIEPCIPGESNLTIAQSINHVGFSIFQSLGNSKNVFFSPLGLTMAIGMAHAGARGETKKQLEIALAYESSNVADAQVHKGIQALCEDMKQHSDGSYSFNIANAFFSQVGLDIREEYLNDLHDHYHAHSKPVNFSGNPREAKDSINEWVHNETSGQINEILDKPLPTSTKLVLSNAIYFKGTWKVQFDKKNTADSYFYVSGERREVIVPMMALFKETFLYLKDEDMGYKYLQLPYEGGKIVMLFVLPLQYDKPANLEMTNDLFCRVMSGMKETKLETVMIPKFKLEYEKSMKDTLKEMGVRDAFEPGVANFSGILSKNGIYISDVLHKAVVEVNEEGSEAAAASGIIFMPVSFRQVEEFIANHSFKFYIVDTTSQAILFSGNFHSPS